MHSSYSLFNYLSKTSSRFITTTDILRKFSTSKMVLIKVGDKLPNADLFEDSPANKINTGDLCNGKKVVLFAVPGAFTPGCSKTHLPGYISKAESMKSNGIHEVVCVSVNDPFVMSAWGKQFNTNGKIRMLADPAGVFTKAMDLGIELPPLGGMRSKRYSMVIDNGVVTSLNIEPDGTGLTCSLAEKIELNK